MNNLIEIKTNESQEPVISGRELHEFLEVKTPYTQWFDRMKYYGFIENVDFATVSQKSEIANGGYQERYDHLIKIDMAKELAMIQRTDKGKQARQYFIQIEREFNSPEKIMARALQIAEKELSTLRLENRVQQQQIAELKPKATYYDLILQCPNLLSMTEIAKDYGMSAKGMNQLLHKLGVQFKQSGVWFLYSKYQDKGYTQTKTQTITRTDGTPDSKTHTYWKQSGRLFLYNLLKENGILPMIEREAM